MGRGTRCYVEQAPDELWLQIHARGLHDDLIWLLYPGDRSLLPTIPGLVLVQMVLPSHTPPDENAVGEGRQVWSIETAKGQLQFPRHVDKFLMLVFAERGHSREVLCRLNRVQIHQQAIFLSDVLTM